MRWGVLCSVILIFLMACSPAEPEQEAVPIEPEPIAEPVVEAVPEPVEEPEEAVVVETAPEEEIYERPPDDPHIIKFLKTYESSVTDYKFEFKNNVWHVKGKKAKMIPFRILENKYHDPVIDTIYFDFKRKTATGACEGHDYNIRKQCTLRNIIGQQYALPYVQFKIPLPDEWLYEVQNLYVFESTSPKLVIDRQTIHLKHSLGTRTTDLFFDPSSGLPVVVIDDSKEYHYDNLAKNQLRTGEDVVPQ